MDRIKFLLERFNPLPCFDWESKTFEAEGQALLDQVDEIKPTILKQSGSIEDWLKTLSGDEEILEIDD